MKKKNSTPRHKRLNREGRLCASKSWLRTYSGKNQKKVLDEQNGISFHLEYAEEFEDNEDIELPF
ncbi:hypothetical protein C0Q44_14975 [Paenibacillus sp. PCH8]|uniref:hypothetical protein n=1 Tax=Paenibacillus sp. PCH8 TaxID=2066524 RepID=UPI000CFA47D9|nr:hypothetical protein [Paenibacillus sp. PCH8]PQP82706.1 hypothetical protein C0Q44_14975 [Paenibacillus sp. PCH8]